MIVGLGLAQLGRRIVCAGNAGLYFEHTLHHGSGLCLAVAHQEEEALHVLAIGVADAGGLLVVLEVVVAIAHGEAALADLHEVHLGVLEVGPAVHAEEGAHAHLAEAGCLILDVGARLDLGNLLEQGLDGLMAEVVAARAIHRQAIEAANLLLERALRVLLGCQPFDEFAQLALVGGRQRVKLGVTGVFGGHGMGFLPSADGILEEVFRRIDRRVEVGLVNTQQRSLGEGTAGGKGQQGEDLLYHNSLVVAYIYGGGMKLIPKLNYSSNG